MKFLNKFDIKSPIKFQYITDKHVTMEDIADCFEAFDAQLQTKAKAYQNLSDADKEVFTKQIKYEDDPQKVDQAFENYTQSFCDEVGTQFPYTQQQLKQSLLKVREIRQRARVHTPTDRITARIYVFNHLLTAEERASVLQDNYLTDKGVSPLKPLGIIGYKGF
jgi:DNA anti-recombination protein RmuC